jgi:hypothetical protein
MKLGLAAGATLVCALAVSSLALTPGTVTGPGPRTFYVTPGLFTGNEALKACGAGYHLASYFEIREPSNFAYDIRRGLRHARYQAGPPVSNGGGGYDPLQAWLDDGQAPNADSNCTGWTDSTGSRGQTMYLYLRTYAFVQADCGEEHHVWCVSDAYAPPEIIRDLAEGR